MYMKRKKFPNTKQFANDVAANLIRTKVDSAYSNEPDAFSEKRILENTGAHSKHQIYMQKLLNSGKSYLDIQAAWHSYYLNLPDDEKHEVWREFYSLQNSKQHTVKSEDLQTQDSVTIYDASQSNDPKQANIISDHSKNLKLARIIKKKITDKISADGRLNAKHHLKSLLFGVGLTALFALITAFTLFNQLFIGPFITPSVNATATPVIIPSGGDITVPPETKLIIPKLNVEAPIVTDAPSNDEATIQKALERGVVLYPNTGKPGELGNQSIFGHSSNNLFNRGDYKYVFVLLSKLEKDDIVYINYESKQYTYKVINKKIIKPTEVGVLSEQPVPALITLITCDPPGANVNRLVIQAEQINPKPDTNKPSTANSNAQNPPVLAGSPESLWRRLLDTLFN